MTLKELLALRKIPYDKDQAARISKAFEFARKAHDGQKRKSGEDYFEHCIESAGIL